MLSGNRGSYNALFYSLICDPNLDRFWIYSSRNGRSSKCAILAGQIKKNQNKLYIVFIVNTSRKHHLSFTNTTGNSRHHRIDQVYTDSEFRAMSLHIYHLQLFISINFQIFFLTIFVNTVTGRYSVITKG